MCLTHECITISPESTIHGFQGQAIVLVSWVVIDSMLRWGMAPSLSDTRVRFQGEVPACGHFLHVCRFSPPGFLFRGPYPVHNTTHHQQRGKRNFGELVLLGHDWYRNGVNPHAWSSLGLYIVALAQW